MARVRSGSGEKIYRIERWLGVNEAQEGEARISSSDVSETTV